MAEPPITVQAYHVSSGDNIPVNRIVIHATAPGIGYPAASASGQSQATAQYFTSASSGGSAHYVVDPMREDHCVHDNAIAWHAPPNHNSIGIELCAEASYTRAQWLSTAVLPVLRMGAKRTGELCTRFSIPVRKLTVQDLLAGRRGVCGHVDVSQAWHESNHTDPGPNFPWDVFFEYVHESISPAPVAVSRHVGADMKLIQVQGDPAIYLMGVGTKWHVPSPTVLKDLQSFLDDPKVHPVSAATRDALSAV